MMESASEVPRAQTMAIVPTKDARLLYRERIVGFSANFVKSAPGQSQARYRQTTLLFM
jgi:hypothetical protein